MKNSSSISQCVEGLMFPFFGQLPPIMATTPSPPFIFQTPHFWQDFSHIIASMKYWIKTKIYFFIVRKLKIKFKWFFYEQYFYKQHKTGI